MTEVATTRSQVGLPEQDLSYTLQRAVQKFAFGFESRKEGKEK